MRGARNPEAIIESMKLSILLIGFRFLELLLDALEEKMAFNSSYWIRDGGEAGVAREQHQAPFNSSYWIQLEPRTQPPKCCAQVFQFFLLDSEFDL